VVDVLGFLDFLIFDFVGLVAFPVCFNILILILCFSSAFH